MGGGGTWKWQGEVPKAGASNSQKRDSIGTSIGGRGAGGVASVKAIESPNVHGEMKDGWESEVIEDDNSHGHNQLLLSKSTSAAWGEEEKRNRDDQREQRESRETVWLDLQVNKLMLDQL